MASKKTMTILMIFVMVLMAGICSSQDIAPCVNNCMPECMEGEGSNKADCLKACEQNCQETKGKGDAIDVEWKIT